MSTTPVPPFLQTSALLTRLPPELLLLILSHLPLSSLLQTSQTCAALRSHLSLSPAAWVPALTVSAREAGIYLSLAPDPHVSREEGEREREVLGGLPRIVPPRAWKELVGLLERGFVLYEMQLPCLKDGEWKEVCEQRFATSVMSREAAKVPPRLAVAARRRKGRYRELFIRTLERYEHMDNSSCLGHEHSCQYVVLHRVHGLTRNRISTREFDAERIMDELKTQNALAEYTTVQLALPPELCPVDVAISAYVTIGRAQSFLRNEVGMELLGRLRVWDEKGTGASHAILGPILFAASLRHTRASRRASWDRQPSLSLELGDLFQAGERVGAGREWWDGRAAVGSLDGFA